MPELKTKVTKESPVAFLRKIQDPEIRKDCLALLKLFKDTTGEKPKMWGTAIVGFGMYHYQSEKSSQKGDWPLTAFSPRKQNITIYIMMGVKKYDTITKKLGKYKASNGSCLYIKRLSDIDTKVLSRLIKASVIDMKKKYG